MVNDEANGISSHDLVYSLSRVCLEVLRKTVTGSGKKPSFKTEQVPNIYGQFPTLHQASRPVTLSPAISMHCTKSCIYSQKVPLKMFVGRNMQR